MKGPTMKHKTFAAAGIAALVGLAAFGAALPASAGPEDPTTITIYGEGTWGHHFSAFRIAKYADVVIETVDGKPMVTGFTLETLGNETFRRALVAEIVALDAGVEDREAAIPTDGGLLVDEMDPLAWVAEYWQHGGTGPDLWGNPTDTTGKVRELANWFQTAVP